GSRTTVYPWRWPSERGARRADRYPRRASRVVGPAHRRAPAPPAALREDRPLEPRLRPARPRTTLLGHREPHEPLVAPARPRQRAVLRRGTARALGGAGRARDQSPPGVLLREIQGAPDRPPRAPGRPLSPDGRRESSRSSAQSERRAPLPAPRQAERR